uniref:Uncharacterized protein n=1 Tax=Arundo donax TaxID=35708 RepID=A0A0A9C3H8_ARUDO
MACCIPMFFKLQRVNLQINKFLGPMCSMMFGDAPMCSSFYLVTR